MLIKCFKHCSDPVKNLLFKSYFSRVYCSQLWSNFNKPVFRKRKTSFNRAFRIFLSLDHRASVSQAMLEAGVNAFDINVLQYIYNFKVRLEKCNNRDIDVLLNSLQFNTSSVIDYCHGKLYA